MNIYDGYFVNLFHVRIINQRIREIETWHVENKLYNISDAFQEQVWQCELVISPNGIKVSFHLTKYELCPHIPI